MRYPRCFISLTLLLTCATAPAQENLELGTMWRFEDPPLAYLEQEYGFKPDSAWFDAVRLASLRFGGGCSASFVSPRGLIITNHHCVRGNIAENQGEHDWVKNGFVAAALGDEVRLRGLTVQQLVATRDITAAVNEGVGPNDDDATVEQKRDTNQGDVLKTAKAEHPELSMQVVSLFQGAVYQLYSYKIYDDVRLVCAPHLQTAHFGGDPDNFTYPRYGIDFGFCRAYEDGEPADTSAHYFRWSESGAQDGELVFVTGNPGSTERLLTKAQLEYLRDANYPIIRKLIDNRIARFRELAENNPDREKGLRTQILSLENAQKAYGGMHEALLDDEFMAHKARAEQAFRDKINADPELRAEFGDVWDAIAEVARQRTELEGPGRFHSPGGSPHIAKAIALVRGIADGDKDQLARVRSRPASTGRMQNAGFLDHLERAALALPTDDPYLKAVLDNGTPQQALQRLADSRINEERFVSELIDGGADAIAASDDLAIQIARLLVPLIDEHAALQQKLETREGVLGTRIGLALFGAYGNKVSPDATFTLRFSDGVVKGYDYNGTVAPYRTTFYGLYGRSAEFDNVYPFDIPKLWMDRKDRVDMTKSVDFVTTNDSTGGNSGSPVINAKRELVGLLFDGNIESLGNQFIFRNDVPRSVNVHVEAIMEALTKIYDADRVAAELRGAAK